MSTNSDLSAFRRAHEMVQGRSRDALAPARARGYEAFADRGLPTTRQEDWRSTSVAPLGKIPFHAPETSLPPSPAAQELFVDGHDGPRLVLVNGRFAPELSRLPALPGGVRVESLAAALRSRPAEVESRLFAGVGPESGAFGSLNAAMLEDGACVTIPRGVVFDRPIHVVHVADAAGEPVLCSPRLLVVLGEGSQATVVETHSGRAGETLTNVVTEMDVAEGAVLEHVQVQLQGPSAFHVSTSSVRVGRSASVRSHVLSLGARLSRHDLRIELAGEGASAEMFGLSFLGHSQHADHHTFVDHAVPHGSSNQVYEGAYAGSSRGVFNGAVRVAPGAQKTDAHQKNRNLILSQDALVDSSPQLEIHADDVRCTHGATIGQLDEDQLFYLLARGVGRHEARQLLVRAFLQGQVDRIRDGALRADLSRRVSARIAELLEAA